MSARNYVIRRRAFGFFTAIAVAAVPVWAAGAPAARRTPPTTPAEAAPAEAAPGPGAVGLADAADPRPGADSPVVIRTYDVADLVRTVPDYPLQEEANSGFEPSSGSGGGNGGGGGGGGGGGQGLFNNGNGQPPAGPAGPMEELVKLVTSLVDRDNWHENGGAVGTAEAFGPTSLVVSQTEANHRAVQQLLDTLRRDAATGTVVEVEARWVLLTPEQLAAWRAAERKAAEGRGADAGGGAEAVRAAAAELVKDESAVVCRATTVGFNGQTVGLTSGRARTVITAANPQVGQAGGLYDFQTGPERAGVSLQVTPRYSREQGTVTVDVRSTVTDDRANGGGGDGRAGADPAGRPPQGPAAALAVATAAIGAPATQPAAGGDVTEATRRVAAALERPARVEQRFRTTVRVRPGTPAIVGGMTLEPGKPGSRQLCLLIDARPVEPPPRAGAGGGNDRPAASTPRR